MNKRIHFFHNIKMQCMYGKNDSSAKVSSVCVKSGVKRVQAYQSNAILGMQHIKSRRKKCK